MTRPGSEPRSTGPMANTLTIMLISYYSLSICLSIYFWFVLLFVYLFISTLFFPFLSFNDLHIISNKNFEPYDQNCYWLHQAATYPSYLSESGWTAKYFFFNGRQKLNARTHGATPMKPGVDQPVRRINMSIVSILSKSMIFSLVWE